MVLFCISMIYANQGFKNPVVNIKDWKASKNIQVYGQDNLYEYINGAADAYLNYEFEKLKVIEYTRDQSSVTIEIYKHSSADNTFGIYSQERPQEGNFIKIGAQGYLEDIVLNFFGDQFYIKLNGFKLGKSKDRILSEFAKKIELRLKLSKKLPPVLKLFPLKNQVNNSTNYQAKDFLGYSFLHSAFTAEYKSESKNYKMFIISGKEKKECLSMLTRYAKTTKLKKQTFNEGFYTFSDPYNGPILMFWKGKYICGITSLKDFKVMKKLIKPLIDNILKL